MRRRTTIILPPGQGINPKAIVVNETSLRTKIPGGDIEERATWDLAELPVELSSALESSHEVHIRWTQASSFHHVSPFLSRLPTGLHVFYTPQTHQPDEQICTSLHAVFGRELKCESLARSFSRLPVLSERFAHSASFQYYQPLATLNYFFDYLRREVCHRVSSETAQACEQYTVALRDAVSIDIDYDTIGHALTLTALWSRPELKDGSRANRSHISIDRISASDRVEVGILSPDTPDEPEELKLGGWLTVLGEDTKASATSFAFPSRHHELSKEFLTIFAADFVQPTGLHPTLAISLPRQATRPPDQSCKLHAYQTMPSSVFVDRYQLSDPDLLAASNLIALHALSGAEDLEAPDWAIGQWGSAALFELATPQETDDAAYNAVPWKVEIPLHLRYLQAPSANTTSYRDLQVPWPIVFWACEAEEGLKMATNPFDRVNLGYDGLFGPKTMFYHVAPARGSLLLDLKVPVLRPENKYWLQVATFATVAAGFCWVLFTLFGPLKRNQKRHAKQE